MTEHAPARLVRGASLAAAALLLAACASDGSSGGGQAQQDERAGRWVNGQWVSARFDDTVSRSGLRERAATRLLEAAEGSDPQLRVNAMEALAVAPARLEPLLDDALTDPNPAVRTVAAMLIGRERITPKVQRLWPLLRDPSPYVQCAAIYALRANAAQPDPTPVGAYLFNSPDPRVRAHAAFVLGEMGNPSALAMLRQAAAASQPGAQAERRLLELQIAEAMVKLGDKEQIQTIRSALYPSRPDELEAAVLALQILGEVGDRRVVDELIAVSRHRDESGNPMPAEAQLVAAEALVKLGEPGAMTLADEHRFDPAPRVRALAALVYGQSARVETLPKLDAMMNDPDPGVQVAAAAGILSVSDRVQRR